MDDLALSRFGDVLILIRRVHVPIILESPCMRLAKAVRKAAKKAARAAAPTMVTPTLHLLRQARHPRRRRNCAAWCVRRFYRSA
jgi:hypothetical protein